MLYCFSVSDACPSDVPHFYEKALYALMPRLTRRIITAALCPLTGETWLPDDALPGFGVRLRADRKTYCVRYRTTGGKTRRENLGLVTVLTLTEARDLARIILVSVRQGKDPAAERLAGRQSPTLADLATRYLAEHATLHKKPESVRHDRANLRRHILPALGKSLVTALARADVARLHHELRATPTTANRCLALLSHMLTMAERWELRPQQSNPARGIQRYKERKMERFLSSEELARLGAALAQAEAHGTEQANVLACIRLLLLTGARVGEILGLRWSEIDMDRGVARLPDSKTGAKLLRLPGAALDILRSLPREKGSHLVLPGRMTGKMLHIPHRPWVRLCAAAGLDGVRIHDLRHTYASFSVMAGLSLPMLGQMLGHSSPAVTNRYTHWAEDPVQDAAEQIGRIISQMVNKTKTT